MRTKLLQVRVRPDTMVMLKAHAKAAGITVSDLVREAISEWIKNRGKK